VPESAGRTVGLHARGDLFTTSRLAGLACKTSPEVVGPVGDPFRPSETAGHHATTDAAIPRAAGCGNEYRRESRSAATVPPRTRHHEGAAW
jgi:hypothetical protein